MGQFGSLRRDTSSCEYACRDVGWGGLLEGGRVRVTGVTDDTSLASSGAPHTVTKGMRVPLDLMKRLRKWSSRKEETLQMKGRRSKGLRKSLR